MFERFTERARRVIILAREEAGRFRHDFVGTEHVLLGLIRDGEGIATAVLQRLGLRLETVKAEVERALAGFPKTLTFGEVPFTPQAKRVLELSIEEARQLGHNYIGTEHLLLGLMKEGQSIAAKILESLGARLDEVRAGDAGPARRSVLPAAQEALADAGPRRVRAGPHPARPGDQARPGHRSRAGDRARHPDPGPPHQEQPGADRRARRGQDRHRRGPGAEDHRRTTSRTCW